jgi:GNAT superfamily N-acetyltransferase
MAIDKEAFRARGDGYAVRPARPADLPAARALILRVIEDDLGYAYTPAWHWDVDDLRGVYLDHPRHILWVATDAAAGHPIATGAVRSGGPQSPPNPPWLAARYDRQRTAQLVRLYVARPHRRRGIARALVALARRFVAAEGGYTVLCLHTDRRAPGAEPFWRAMPTTLIYDPRGEGPFGDTLHFELALADPAHPEDGDASSEE